MKTLALLVVIAVLTVPSWGQVCIDFHKKETPGIV
jgi:hypothetical protein